jgi:hypothetical protein
MSFTMNNGLFTALFRLDCTIVERDDELISMEYFGVKVVLKSNGDYLGPSCEVVTTITMSVSSII